MRSGRIGLHSISITYTSISRNTTSNQPLWKYDMNKHITRLTNFTFLYSGGLLIPRAAGSLHLLKNK